MSTLAAVVAIALGCAAGAAAQTQAPASKRAAKSASKRGAKPAPKPAADTQPAAPADKWPIASLRVEGAQRYTPAQIFAVAGLRAGQLAGKPEFDAARDRLEASGAFQTIGYRFAPDPGGKGYNATFQVQEIAEALPFRFDRLGAADSELQAWLKKQDPLYAEKIPASDPSLRKYARWIEEFLAARQRPEKVIGKVVPSATGEMVVTFQPDSPLPAVALVHFKGNQAISETKLRDAVSGVAFGLPFTEERFRQMLDASVRPHYEALGRLGVAFPKVVAEPSKEVKGLDVTVEIAEGPEYTLDDVAFENTEGVKPEELINIGAFETGGLARYDRVLAGVEAIKKAYRKNGHMRVDAAVTRKLDQRTKTVDVLVALTPGPKFTMGRLRIEGLDIHGEAAIKKLWAMTLGKPYNADYPDFFLEKVREQGVFDDLGKTKAAAQVNDDQTVDVTLSFQFAPTTQRYGPPPPKKAPR